MPAEDTTSNFDLIETSSAEGGCSCGGCGCGADTTQPATEAAATAAAAAKENVMTTSHTYLVTGMTCGHCASTVTEELNGLSGVSDVSVDLVAGGASSVKVTSTHPLDESQVSAALNEAGDYHLA